MINFDYNFINNFFRFLARSAITYKRHEFCNTVITG